MADPAGPGAAASSGLPFVAIEDVRLTRRVELVMPRGQALSPVARAFADHVTRKRVSVGSRGREASPA